MYEKLLYAFGNILKKFKKCFKFLLPIGIGVVLGFLFGFFGIRALLNIMMFVVVAFFAGLMLGVYPSVAREIKGQKLTFWNTFLFVVGICVPVLISVVSVHVGDGCRTLENLKFYHYIVFVLLGFLIAITQLVPGLSATALLMAFGYFSPLMDSVSLSAIHSNPAILLVYLCLIIGFVFGLIIVSKWMSRLIKKRKAPTFSTICGLSLGSIISMFYNPEIVSVYSSWTLKTALADLVPGVIVFVIGVVISYMFVRYERSKTNK